MEVFEAINKRRSIRKYLETQIPQEVLEKILHAGRLAPSAKNQQPWRFVVVTDKEVKEKLVPACVNQAMVGEAGAVIAIVGVNPTYVMRAGFPAQIIDTGIALSHMCLAATSEGLGTCIIGAFLPEEVKKVLEVPEEYQVVQLLVVGYPAEDPAPRPRLPLEEIVYYNRWGNK